MSDPQGSESTTPPISEEDTAAGSGGDLATGGGGDLATGGGGDLATGGDDDGPGVHDGVPLTRDAALQRDDPDDQLPARTPDDVAASQQSGPA